MQSSDLLSKVPALPVLSDLTKPSLWQINSSGQASARKFAVQISCEPQACRQTRTAILAVPADQKSADF